MLWIVSYSKPSQYFFLPVILVQVNLIVSSVCPNNALPELVSLAKSNLGFLEFNELLTPCGKPYVFALRKSSLDCRLCQ